MTTGYVDNHLEQTVDFDYDAIDEHLTGKAIKPPIPRPIPEIINSSREAITSARLLHHIVSVGAMNPRETMVWMNVFLFVMGLHPNQSEPGEKIAAGLKLEKPEWFRRVSRMRRILKSRGLFLPRIAGEWSKPAIESIKNKTTQYHEQRQPTVNLAAEFISEAFARKGTRNQGALPQCGGDRDAGNRTSV